MSSAATATRIPFATARHRIAPIARALVWEECRVGGVVTVVCAAVGAALLATMRQAVGIAAWEQADPLLTPLVLILPMAIAFMIILNPANSGHLGGGFAKRVLWLPVPVPLAVGIALGMRAVFVLAASMGLFAATHMIFEGGPSYSLALVFVVFYLMVQTIDWCRAAIAGLETAIALALLLISTVLLAFLPDVVTNLYPALASMGQLGAAALVLCALPAAYGVSIAAVSATRAGRTIGANSAREKSRALHSPGATRQPFRSPLAARVWQELRQFGWTIPAGTALITLVTATVIWLGGWYVRGGATSPVLAAFAMYGAVMLSAAAHGLHARVLGLRVQPGKPGFHLLLPLSSAQAALAKCLANALILVSTIAAATLTQLLLTSTGFLGEIVPFALANGMTSPHEVAWTLLGRPIFLLLVAWSLTAIGTRGARRIFAVLVALWMLSPVIGLIVDTRLLIWSVVPISTVIAYGLAWRRGLITSRTVAAWGALWVVTAWLLRGAVSDTPLTPVMMAECINYSALLPLPFALFVLDMARRRHGAAAAHERGASSSTGFRMKPWGWAIAAPVLALALWMGRPMDPVYKAYLQAEGTPLSLEDLNGLYPAVPDEENAALRYLAAGTRLRELREAYRESHTLGTAVSDSDDWRQVYSFRESREILEGDTHGVAMAYWETVTATIAPELREIAYEGLQRSRYPLDLERLWPNVSGYLSALRSLARELELDAYVAVRAGDNARALACVEAMLAMQDSLHPEPILTSQWTRFGILSVALNIVIGLLEEAQLTGPELAQIDRALQHALPPIHERRVIEDSLRMQRTIELIELDAYWTQVLIQELGPLGNTARVYHTTDYLLTHLIMQPAANRTVSLAGFEHARLLANELAMEPESGNRLRVRGDYEVGMMFLAPVNYGDDSRYRNLYSQEWGIRMEIAIARTAIAIERYRRDHGRLPDSLHDLVPAYLDGVAYDVYAMERGTPVRYLRHDDGGFTLYSVGRSGIDHRANPGNTIRPFYNDDIVFEVSARREGARNE